MNYEEVILNLLVGLQLYSANAAAGPVLSCHSVSHGRLVEASLDVTESVQGLTYTFSMEDTTARTVFFRTGNLERTEDGFQDLNRASIIVGGGQIIFQDHLTHMETRFVGPQCTPVTP